MSKTINLQHRHFVLIAETLAETLRSGVLDQAQHADVTWTFADKLACTNPKFDRKRFIQCAMGTPSTGRDA